MSFLLMLTMALAALQDPTPADGVLTGRVVQAGSTDGIPKVEIVLAGPLPPQAINAAISNPLMLAEIAEGSSAPLTRTTTEADGTFAFRNLASGQYAVRAQLEGYLGDVSVTTGSVLNVSSTTLTISAGGSPRDVRFSLIRGGTMSGRVRDASGQPAPSRRVTAFQIGYDARTGREVLTAATSRTTDDRGEYRLFWLAPGDYYIGVSTAAAAPGFSFQTNMVMRTFFPNAADARSSTVITLGEGLEFSGADIDLRPPSAFKVSGRIVSELGEATPNTFYLFPTDPNTLTEAGSLGVLSFANQGPKPGLFEIQGVPSGTYDLVAALPDSNRLPFPGRVRIDVGSQDVENVTLTIGAGVAVKARVLLDGELVPAMPAPPAGAGPRVTLRSRESFANPFDNYIAGTVTTDEGGAWIFPNVPSSVYAVDVSGIPSNAYVDAIRVGNRSVTESGLEISDRSPETIDVIMRSGALSIQGGVQNADGSPVNSATVVLVPAAEKRQNSWLYKTVRVDAGGEFRLSGVAPGEYKLFAWENLPNGAYRNAAFLAKHESRGLSVNLVAGGNLDFDLTVIP